MRLLWLLSGSPMEERGGQKPQKEESGFTVSDRGGQDSSGRHYRYVSFAFFSVYISIYVVWNLASVCVSVYLVYFSAYVGLYL